MHETGHESPKLIMYLSFTLIMLVRSSASNKFVIQKMTPRKKYYKNSCNNENISTESIEEDVLDKIYDPNIDLWTGYTTCTCMTKYIEELTNTTITIYSIHNRNMPVETRLHPSSHFFRISAATVSNFC